MRKIRVPLMLILFGLLTLAAYAADMTGQWKSQAGDNPSFAFTLKADGAALTGAMQGPDGEDRSIADGKLDGDNISFTVMSEWQGNPIKLVATGTVKGDGIDLNIGTEDGSWGTETTLKRAPQTGK
jgi:hypothetical protein